MTTGQRKPEGQWTRDERKAANLDQRLKSLIMSTLLDDQMNFVINCLTIKSTWDDLILYHEGPSDVKESKVMDLKLCYNTFKFKEGKSLTQTFTRYKALMNELVNDGIKLSKLERNTDFINRHINSLKFDLSLQGLECAFFVFINTQEEYPSAGLGLKVTCTKGFVLKFNASAGTSGKILEGPSTPLVPTPDVSNSQKEPEQNPETSTENVQNPNLENIAHVPPPEEEESIFMEIPKPKAKKTVNFDPNSPNPNSYPSKLPYPERMKVRENDKPSAQHSRFLKMFKQLRLEIGLKDAIVEMPKFNKWLSGLLRNKEKLEEIAITTVNAECSAIIMNKVLEKLEDPGKFLIPCALHELDRTSALANSGASINLLPHSIYKKLGLGALAPTQMTLELAHRSITHPMGIGEDVVVRVDGFTFLVDFVVVNFEPDPRV
ncbi:retrovirus-related pol polyprotein from transposon TNT 1-94, partial [Tanacetum coccineum]